MKTIRFCFLLLSVLFATVISLAQEQETVKLVNLSCRVHLSDKPVHAGFVVGRETTVLIRAVGPSLNAFGLAPCKDPYITLFRQSDGVAINWNDDWADSREMRLIFNQTGAFALLSSSKDAALLVTLPAGAYSAVVNSNDGSSGIVLLEIYDAGWRTPNGLINLSVRGKAGIGDQVLIVGVTEGGIGLGAFLYRAVGPGLAQFGVQGFLPDPTISVVDPGSGFTLAENDNWEPQFSNGYFGLRGAFSLPSGSKDSAAARIRGQTIGGGPSSTIGSTVIVKDKNGDSGEVLVEVYLYHQAPIIRPPS